MTFGLKTEELEYLKTKLSSFDEIEQAVIFGSRAKGTEKTASDVDLAIYGENINFDIIARLHDILEEESSMPYYFDVVDYTHLEDISIKNHIDRVGKKVYEKYNIEE